MLFYTISFQWELLHTIKGFSAPFSFLLFEYCMHVDLSLKYIAYALLIHLYNEKVLYETLKIFFLCLAYIYTCTNSIKHFENISLPSAHNISWRLTRSMDGLILLKSAQRFCVSPLLLESTTDHILSNSSPVWDNSHWGTCKYTNRNYCRNAWNTESREGNNYYMFFST